MIKRERGMRRDTMYVQNPLKNSKRKIERLFVHNPNETYTQKELQASCFRQDLDAA